MASNDSNNNLPRNFVYILMLMSFAIGFLLATLIASNNTQSQIVKQPIGSNVSQGMNVNADLNSHIAELELKVAQNPDNATDWEHLGNLYFDTQQFQKSVDAYTKSLAIAPNNTNVMTDMGTMYRALGQFETALSTYDKVLAINPNHQNARLNRGVVLIFDLNRKQEGINTWKILVQKFPTITTPDGRLLSDYIKELEQN